MTFSNIKFRFEWHPFLLCLLFVLAGQSMTFAQEKKKEEVTSPETPKDKKLEKKLQNKLYSPQQFWHESVLFVKQPTKWKGRDWIRVGMVTAATLTVMPFDEKITNTTRGEQHYYKSVPVTAGRVYGEWYSIVAVAGAFGVYGLIAKDTASKKISIELLQAGLYSEIVTTVLKVAIGRQRPAYTLNAFNFQPFSMNYEYHSMPSGHTTSAFALSAVMSRHAHSTWLKILAYVPAGFTMFSRLYQHQHWQSDEILAAGIGYFVGNWVVDLHEGKRHRINVTSLAPIGISFAINRPASILRPMHGKVLPPR